VVSANDEFFAEKENLIKPGDPVFTPETYGHKGQVYDGWESRRRRANGASHSGADHDWAIVRLGAPGVIHAVVVDTAFFTGNFPERCSVDATCSDGFDLDGAAWEEIVPPSVLRGDDMHVFEVSSPRRFTHVRLNIYPDGGVARLRVHGVIVPDPSFLRGLTFDLAALQNGADIADCSDTFYSAPRNALSPGLSRVMGEGWETRRRRRPGNEWLVVRLAGEGLVRVAEIDTSGYLGNAPGFASLEGNAGDEWFPLLPRIALLPDTPHRFVIGGETPVTHVRLNLYPDGGVARLRLHGPLTSSGLNAIERRWHETAGPSGDPGASPR
jgi:allantoicase